MVTETLIYTGLCAALVIIGWLSADRRVFFVSVALALAYFATGLFMADPHPIAEGLCSVAMWLVFFRFSFRFADEDEAQWWPAILVLLETIMLGLTVASGLMPPLHWSIAINVVFIAQILITGGAGLNRLAGLLTNGTRLSLRERLGRILG